MCGCCIECGEQGVGGMRDDLWQDAEPCLVYDISDRWSVNVDKYLGIYDCFDLFAVLDELVFGCSAVYRHPVSVELLVVGIGNVDPYVCVV